MALADSEHEHFPESVKMVVAGGFGVGKTTFIGSVSEIPPLRTEETMTEASEGLDDLHGVERKTTTTVAMDFGRITMNPEIVLYLFGTPGQDRFKRIWNDLAFGALGAVVLLDTRRLDAGFAAIDFFECYKRIPFVVAVNCFDGAYRYGEDKIRQAAALAHDVPVVMIDAREREACKRVLLRLVDHALAKHTTAQVTA